MRIIAQQRRIWTQLVCCVAAYAFALQLMLVGCAPPPVAALDAGQDALTAALCLHDGGAPIAPADNSSGDHHCKLCTAGGHHAFTAPAAAHYAIVRTGEAAVLPPAERFAFRSHAFACAQPRGPPPTA